MAGEEDATRTSIPIQISTPQGPVGTGTFLCLHLTGAVFPFLAGMALYGWRAGGCVALVLLSALAGALVWRRVGLRGRQVRLPHCLYLGLLLSLMLPAHLLNGRAVDGFAPWPILVAGGLTLVTLVWLFGGLGVQRVPTTVVTFLILSCLFGPLLTPRLVLRRDRLFAGDLLHADPTPRQQSLEMPWYQASSDTASSPAADAMWRSSPAAQLTAYTAEAGIFGVTRRADRGSLTVHALIRDRLPPLEDLIIAGQSAPIGLGSGVAVILGGLVLIYQGLVDHRVPLLSLLSAMAAFLILPIPVLLSESGNQWHWLSLRQHVLGWQTGITFMNYELFTSPLLFMVFFLASSPGIRPMTRRGRIIFALLLGGMSAALQLYLSASIGPYMALLLVGLLTPALDRAFPPRTLV